MQKSPPNMSLEDLQPELGAMDVYASRKCDLHLFDFMFCSALLSGHCFKH